MTRRQLLASLLVAGTSGAPTRAQDPHQVAEINNRLSDIRRSANEFVEYMSEPFWEKLKTAWDEMAHSVNNASPMTVDLALKRKIDAVDEVWKDATDRLRSLLTKVRRLSR